jgi:protein-S-isoprenylcysteine O-methyltransferase Ste14
MKLGSGAEFRFVTPKYQRVWGPLLYVGFALIWIARQIFPGWPDWISTVGFLIILVGLVVSLFGAIAERRDWKAKRKIETKRCGDAVTQA